MEKLYELVHSDEFDIVVVDTPPTRNALDLLDAPRRLTRFLENRLFRALMVPTRMSAAGGERGHAGAAADDCAGGGRRDRAGRRVLLPGLRGHGGRVPQPGQRRARAAGRPGHRLRARDLGPARRRRRGRLLRREAGRARRRGGRAGGEPDRTVVRRHRPPADGRVVAGTGGAGGEPGRAERGGGPGGGGLRRAGRPGGARPGRAASRSSAHDVHELGRAAAGRRRHLFVRDADCARAAARWATGRPQGRSGSVPLRADHPGRQRRADAAQGDRGRHQRARHRGARRDLGARGGGVRRRGVARSGHRRHADGQHGRHGGHAWSCASRSPTTRSTTSRC